MRYEVCGMQSASCGAWCIGMYCASYGVWRIGMYGASYGVWCVVHHVAYNFHK